MQDLTSALFNITLTQFYPGYETCCNHTLKRINMRNTAGGNTRSGSVFVGPSFSPAAWNNTEPFSPWSTIMDPVFVEFIISGAEQVGSFTNLMPRSLIFSNFDGQYLA